MMMVVTLTPRLMITRTILMCFEKKGLFRIIIVAPKLDKSGFIEFEKRVRLFGVFGRNKQQPQQTTPKKEQ